MPLTTQQIDQVVDLVYATAEVLGQEIRPAAAGLIAEDLSAYPFQEISRALARCRAELHGKLTLAAIIERLPSANAHLSGNEAWALALHSTDAAGDRGVDAGNCPSVCCRQAGALRW